MAALRLDRLASISGSRAMWRWMPYAAASLVCISWILAMPIWPVDETRYVSVAWEMWRRDDYLVPHLNDAPYSHKPPLLFWFINLGWWIFGVNDWWPRVVPALFALGSLRLIRVIARQCWPERAEVALVAPTVLVGSLFWIAATPLIMFDMLNTFFALLASYGLLAARAGRTSGWVVVSAALGLGVLAKGPVIFLYTMPLAILFPIVFSELRPRWGRWFIGLVGAICGAVTIVVGWLLPAVVSGGPEYAQMVLWGQSAGRMIQSFAHARPFWWYLAVLPIVVFPWWTIRAGLFRKIRELARPSIDPTVALILIWLTTELLIFSAISGKQPHYLMPLVPVVALLIARLLADSTLLINRNALLAPMGTSLLIGIVVLVLEYLATQSTPQLASNLYLQLIGWSVLAACFGGVWVRLAEAVPAPLAVGLIGLSTLTLTLFLVMGPFRAVRPIFDLQRVSELIAEKQQAGHPIAVVGGYSGEFHYLGRLTRPIDTIQRGAEPRWSTANPSGWVVQKIKGGTSKPPFAEDAAYSARSRGGYLVIWPAQHFIPSSSS